MAGWRSPCLIAKVTVSGRRETVTGTLVAEDAIYAANHWDGDLVKLDRKSLREDWRVPGGEDPIALYGRILLVAGTETHAIDTETGRRLWTRPSRFGMLNWNGKPILQHENRPFEIVEPGTGVTTEILEVPRTSPISLCGDMLLFRTDPGNDPVRAFSLAERREIWARDLFAEIEGPPDPRPMGLRESKSTPLLHFVPGGPRRFVVTCGEETLGCSLEDGSLLWRAPVPVPYDRPNVHEGRVYVLCLDRFIAADEARGEIVYDVKHSELREAYRARPGTVFGGTIAFANESGHLAVFNLWNGSLVWSYKYKAPLWGTAEADGRLLVSTGDGKLLVFAEKSAA
jgi:outer membrane protein assembly factor BamB